MREIQEKIYSFDELSEEAKQKVLQKFTEWASQDDYYYEHVLDDAETVAEILGIEFARVKPNNSLAKSKPEIYWSGFYHQGSGLGFSGYYYYRKQAPVKIKAEFPADVELFRIAKALQSLQSKYFYKLTATITSRNDQYCIIETEHYEDRYREIEKNDQDEMTEIINDFAQWIYSKLQEAYEYCTSEEAILDNIHASEYEFYKDGEIYYG